MRWIAAAAATRFREIVSERSSRTWHAASPPESTFGPAGRVARRHAFAAQVRDARNRLSPAQLFLLGLWPAGVLPDANGDRRGAALFQVLVGLRFLLFLVAAHLTLGHDDLPWRPVELMARATITNPDAVCMQTARNRGRGGLFRGQRPANLRAALPARPTSTPPEHARILRRRRATIKPLHFREVCHETHRTLVAAGLLLSLPAAGAYAATAAAPILRRRRPQARKRRGDQGFCDLLRHPRHAQRQEIQRHPDGDGDLGQSSPARLHDRPRQGARHRQIFHRLHRRDRQRASRPRRAIRRRSRACNSRNSPSATWCNRSIA